MAISQAIAPRNAKNRPYVLKKGVSVISDLADGGAVYGYPGDYYGRIYYVNNITGSSSYDGLSWDTPFDQLSTAITASEVYRQLPSSTTNEYSRNIIYVQGTGTAYTKLSTFPNHCDIIGIGANPRGYHEGVPYVQSTTGVDTVDGTCEGLYVANMQFGGTGTGYAMDLTQITKSAFDNCCFWNKTSGGIRIGIAGAVRFSNCQIGGGDTSNGATGFEITGDNFNACVIEDCYIFGTTTGLKVTSNTNQANNTWVRNNFIHGATIGVDDNSTMSSHNHWVFYTGNYVQSADCFDIEGAGNGLKQIGNHANAAGSSAWEDAIS